MLESSSPSRLPVRRGRRVLLVALAALGLGLLLMGHRSGFGRVDLADVELPANPDAAPPALRQAAPTIQVRLRGLPLGVVQVEVDGQPLPGEVNWWKRTLTARSAPLADGGHRLAVHHGDHHQSWSFTVDTRPPDLRVTAPPPGALVRGRRLALRGRGEPGALVRARWGRAGAQGRVGPDGAFSLQVPLVHGPGTLHWQASDAAGNLTSGSLRLKCDQTPPTLSASFPEAPPEGPAGIILKTASPTLRLVPADPDSGVRRVHLRVDGGPARDVPLEEAGKPIEIRLPGLPEGLRRLEVTVRNGAGADTVRKSEFLVDSTEKFGQATLTLGARGRDVEELQRRLAARGYLREAEAAGQFGEPTRKAILAMQQAAGLKPDGVAGPYTIGALSSQIYVNLSQFSLVLVKWDGSTRSYLVAHGTTEHPTPTGSFFVADLARDPTWIPPDSPWAQEAKVTPPGPGNPLGTRWIGLDHGAVGIHGTPAGWTVGSRASHGCVRMTIPDVEDLFEHVDLGTQVRILEGTEDDPILGDLWPGSSR